MLLMILLICGQMKEELSPAYQLTINRLDGRQVNCVARKVITGHPTRIGKWVVLYELPDDPYGFVAWLNYFRAARGLRAVHHDTNLAADAAWNNLPQLQARRSGHYVPGPGFQVAYYGPTTAEEAIRGFLASPAHSQYLLDPTIQVAGVAVLYNSWTVLLR